MATPNREKPKEEEEEEEDIVSAYISRGPGAFPGFIAPIALTIFFREA